MTAMGRPRAVSQDEKQTAAHIIAGRNAQLGILHNMFVNSSTGVWKT